MRVLPVLLATCFLLTASLARGAVFEHRIVKFHHTDKHLDGTAPLLTVTKQISATGPTLTFKLFRVRSHSNYHYRIEVCSDDGSRTIQQLGIRNGIGVEYRRDSFRVLDIDADGFADIRLSRRLRQVRQV